MYISIHTYTHTLDLAFFFSLESWRFSTAVLSNTHWRASLLLNCSYDLTYVLFKWSPHPGDTNLLAESKYHWVYPGDERLVLCYFTNHSLPFTKGSETVVWELGHLLPISSSDTKLSFCWCCNLLLRRCGQHKGIWRTCQPYCCALPQVLKPLLSAAFLLSFRNILSLHSTQHFQLQEKRMKKESCYSTVDKPEVWVFILKSFMYF